MNSTERNPGSKIWRKLNGFLTQEEWDQKPCFICESPFHSAKTQKHVDGWGVCDCNCHEPCWEIPDIISILNEDDERLKNMNCFSNNTAQLIAEKRGEHLRKLLTIRKIIK